MRASESNVYWSKQYFNWRAIFLLRSESSSEIQNHPPRRNFIFNIRWNKMKFIKMLIFSYIVRFSNYYNNYLKNWFLRNYGPTAETAGHVLFSFAQEKSVKNAFKILDTVIWYFIVKYNFMKSTLLRANYYLIYGLLCHKYELHSFYMKQILLRRNSCSIILDE